MYKINNMNANYQNYKFIVARFVDDEFWFYGCFNDENKADEVAAMVHGICVCSERVIPA